MTSLSPGFAPSFCRWNRMPSARSYSSAYATTRSWFSPSRYVTLRLTARLFVSSSASVSALVIVPALISVIPGPAFQFHHQRMLGAQVDLRLELEFPFRHVAQPVTARHLVQVHVHLVQREGFPDAMPGTGGER